MSEKQKTSNVELVINYNDNDENKINIDFNCKLDKSNKARILTKKYNICDLAMKI